MKLSTGIEELIEYSFRSKLELINNISKDYLNNIRKIELIIENSAISSVTYQEVSRQLVHISNMLPILSDILVFLESDRDSIVGLLVRREIRETIGVLILEEITINLKDLFQQILEFHNQVSLLNNKLAIRVQSGIAGC